MGCFFGPLTQQTFGIDQEQLMDTEHFTIGYAEEDARVQTIPPYAHLRRWRELEDRDAVRIDLEERALAELKETCRGQCAACGRREESKEDCFKRSSSWGDLSLSSSNCSKETQQGNYQDLRSQLVVRSQSWGNLSDMSTNWNDQRGRDPVGERKFSHDSSGVPFEEKLVVVSI
mmetsp:Transcript_34999/g.63059  ORF Transcript_34999/g.63059 Transcript_34999/m.63059 type:complete len:174 (-) Transcript_34999:165-686(-)